MKPSISCLQRQKLKREINQKFLQGKTIEEVKMEYGHIYTAATIKSLFYKSGIGKVNQKKADGKINIRNANIIHLYYKLNSIHKVKKRFDVSHETVRQVLIKNNIQYRQIRKEKKKTLIQESGLSKNGLLSKTPSQIRRLIATSENKNKLNKRDLSIKNDFKINKLRLHELVRKYKLSYGRIRYILTIKFNLRYQQHVRGADAIKLYKRALLYYSRNSDKTYFQVGKKFSRTAAWFCYVVGRSKKKQWAI